MSDVVVVLILLHLSLECRRSRFALHNMYVIRTRRKWHKEDHNMP